MYEIIFWHGFNQALFDKLKTFCFSLNEDLIFSGTLDEFADYYDSKFLVQPLNKTIYVTQKNNFGQE